MTGTPHLPRLDGPRPRPKCLDCGETRRAKFYAHPKNKTGVQRRCKVCDNAKRIANQRAERDEPRHEVTVVTGVEGASIYVNGYRVAGAKPWGGGTIRHRFEVEGHEIRTALKRASHPISEKR